MTISLCMNLEDRFLELRVRQKVPNMISNKLDETAKRQRGGRKVDQKNFKWVNS